MEIIFLKKIFNSAFKSVWIYIHFFMVIHPFTGQTYWAPIVYPVIALGTGNAIMNKTKSLPTWSFQFKGGRADIQYTNNQVKYKVCQNVISSVEKNKAKSGLESARGGKALQIKWHFSWDMQEVNLTAKQEKQTYFINSVHFG